MPCSAVHGVHGQQQINGAGMQKSAILRIRQIQIQFFFHVLYTPPLNEFNMQEQLFEHFEVLLSTADKPLKLTVQNFPLKVTSMRKYPECVVNTGSLFDEDGDPIFNMEVTSTPISPIGKKSKGWKKRVVP